MRVHLFPGQGVQGPGMAGALWSSATFAEASGALGVDLPALCRDGRAGPADLTSTAWAQPAIVAASVAGSRAAGRPGAVCGHSLGEFSALVVAGALGLREALGLVAVRGRAMDEACAAQPGGMLAVIGLDPAVASAACEGTGAVIAADNAPGQLVAAGPHDALEVAARRVREAGGRTAPLSTAGAFHSPSMLPARRALAEALDAAAISRPSIAFWSSTTASRLDDPSEIRDALLAQLTAPVLFRPAVALLAAAGASTFVDAGPGRVLAGLARRIAPDVRVAVAEDALAAGR